MLKRLNPFVTLLFGFLLLLVACKSSHTKKIEQAQLSTAKRLVSLIANYSPKNAESNFSKAKELLSGPIKKSFGEGILGAELAAIKAVGRKQSFSLQESATELVHVSDRETIAGFLGFRVREVKGKTGAPIEVTYQITLEPNPENQDKPDIISFVVTNVEVQLTQGQEKAISEERLLEKFNEAADAAREERKKFVEAVNMVSDDLKAHEKKVEENFGKLSESLEKLGGTVKKLKNETQEMHKKRVEKILEARKKAQAEKEPAQSSSSSAPKEESHSL